MVNFRQDVRKFITFSSICKQQELSRYSLFLSGGFKFIRSFAYPTATATMVKEKRNIIHRRTYEDAIRTLNGLQTNAAVISQIRKERGRMQRNSLPAMQSFLSRININVSDLDQLNVIHISGTKGKGSTAAFCESIMRHSGMKTGLYSSPHLVEVRERIRINGKPLDQNSFAKYFFACYDALIATSAEHDAQMPGYFRFLTLMAFYVFLQEQLDVVVLEVGIGGSYDCTNIVNNPVVCGISKLGLDHTGLLGNTIEQIAWHKSGIMKPGHPAVTIPQYDSAESVLFERAKELKATLQMVPDLGKYGRLALGLEGEHQEINAAMALQLCRIWLYKQKEYLSGRQLQGLESLLEVNPLDNTKCLQPFQLPLTFSTGLSCTSWPGRCQIIARKHITFFIDGAHTPESVDACVKWVKSKQDDDVMLPRDAIFRVLMFNVSGERDEYTLLKSLSEIDFDHAIFCPSIIESSGENSADMTNFNLSRDARLRVCDKNQNTWLSMHGADQKLDSAIDTSSSHIGTTLESSSISSVFPNIRGAIQWVANGKDVEIAKPEGCGPSYPSKRMYCEHIQIVVTGSLHLVGGVIRCLGPQICDVS